MISDPHKFHGKIDIPKTNREHKIVELSNLYVRLQAAEYTPRMGRKTREKLEVAYLLKTCKILYRNIQKNGFMFQISPITATVYKFFNSYTDGWPTRR